MKYGYVRVSTYGQAKKENSLEHQSRVLKEHGCEELFIETYTGTKADRPQFQKLLSILKEGDTFIATKLDRFARSTIEGISIVSDLLEKGVTVHIIDIGLLNNSPQNKLIRTFFLGFAEFERDIIYERTSEGKAIARENPDFREGRPPKFKRSQLEHALNLLGHHTYKEVEELTGISKTTLWRFKRKKELEEL